MKCSECEYAPKCVDIESVECDPRCDEMVSIVERIKRKRKQQKQNIMGEEKMEVFIRNVRMMRQAQKDYFANRDHNALDTAKDYGRRVDKQLAEFFPPAQEQKTDDVVGMTFVSEDKEIPFIDDELM